jgi:hypothetical protein
MSPQNRQKTPFAHTFPFLVMLTGPKTRQSAQRTNAHTDKLIFGGLKNATQLV